MVLRLNMVLLLPVVLLLAGCTGGMDNSKENLDERGGPKNPIPVSGKVTVDGEGVPRVFIYAYTKEGGMKPVSECTSEPDGSFCFATQTKCDGLEAGDYRLAFALRDKAGKGKDEGQDRFGGKYRNPMENDFTLLVETGKPQTDLSYELQSE